MFPIPIFIPSRSSGEDIEFGKLGAAVILLILSLGVVGAVLQFHNHWFLAGLYYQTTTGEVMDSIMAGLASMIGAVLAIGFVSLVAFAVSTLFSRPMEAVEGSTTDEA